ncbi:hypothetical protein GEMRC1_007299 [Eukaryota sp. GEM-RC1]
MSLASAFIRSYKQSNDQRVVLIDMFILFHIVLLAVIFSYGFIAGTFPFNSFISAVFTCLGSAVLTINLRLQTHPSTSLDFPSITPGSAFVGFVVAHLLLFLVAFNFMG